LDASATTEEAAMPTKEQREVPREIALKTADEGNIPGRPLLPGVLIAIVAALALLLVYLAMAAAPPQPADPTPKPPLTR